MFYHNYYFKCLQPLKTINIRELEFYIWSVRIIYQSKINWLILNSCKHLMRLVSFQDLTCLWSRNLYFLKNKQGIRACVVSNFHPGLEKLSIIWEIWNFHPGLKFHLGLAKPSWNFNSVYRVEIFTCNCNAILKRSLLFSRDKISTRFKELKFQSGLKISI